MSGARSRRKGDNYERRICGILSDALGSVVRRKLGAARDGGDDTPAGWEAGPFSIEMKNHRVIRLREWIKQARDNSGDRVPVVVFHLHGTSEDWAAITLEDLIPMMCGEIIGSDQECGNGKD